MRQLQSGDILCVTSDDPAAREGVPAWSRLTGNTLVEINIIDETRTEFHLRKK